MSRHVISRHYQLATSPALDYQRFMSRALWPLSVVTLIYFLWNVNTTSYAISSGWDVDWGYLFLNFLYWPAVIAAWACGLCALYLAIRKASRSAWVQLCLSLPMVGYSLYYPAYPTLKKYSYESNLRYESFSYSQAVAFHLVKYARENPSSVKWVGSDEQIAPAGFVAYLKNLQPPPAYYSEGKSSPFHLSESEVLTLWGKPFILGVDRNGDGYLEIGSQRGSLKPGYADPWGDGNFYYSLGAGCLPSDIPPAIFETGAAYVTTSNDVEYERLRESQSYQQR